MPDPDKDLNNSFAEDVERRRPTAGEPVVTREPEGTLSFMDGIRFGFGFSLAAAVVGMAAYIVLTIIARARGV